MTITTENLLLRQLTPGDFPLVAPMLQDAEVMYAWEQPFSDAEVTEWLDKRITGYAQNGYDYLLALEKATGKVVGQIGLLKETINGKDCIGLGYILCKEYWGRGYASEGARACLDYAFNVLKAEEVAADIRPSNIKSIALAKRLGMTEVGEYVKYYKNKPMPHIICLIMRQNW